MEAVRANNNVVSFNGDRCVGCAGTGPVLTSRFCVPCSTSTVQFEIPSVPEFNGGTHLHAPELADVGSRLISSYDDFDHLEHFNARIDYLWKEKGGKKDGQNILARIQKPKGELAFYSGKDYILWVAADHCFGFNKFQVSAVLYHELLHTDFIEQEHEFTLRGHDFEGFTREIEVFGEWRHSIRTIGEAFKNLQGSLFLDA